MEIPHRFEKTIRIPYDELKYIENMFYWGKEDLLNNNLPLNSKLQSWTARFRKYDIDINLNSSDDGCWSEVILYDKKGNSISDTGVTYQLEGTLGFRVDNEDYWVTVKRTRNKTSNTNNTTDKGVKHDNHRT